MPDVTRLVRGLEDYIATLERHLVQLRDHGAQLDAAWIRLREVYHGQGADMFAQAFERTRQMIGIYSTTAEAVVPVMRDRVEALGQFDAQDPSPL